MIKKNWTLAGWLSLAVGFCMGVIVAGLSPAAGAIVWLVSWAVAATFFIGGRMVRNRDVTPMIRTTAEYDAEYQAALEAARAELARLEAMNAMPLSPPLAKVANQDHPSEAAVGTVSERS